MRSFLKYFLLIICFTFNIESLVSASGGSPPPTKPNASLELLEKGKLLFLKFCAHCHGNHGGGDGFNAEFIDKDPVELSDPKFQAKRTNEKLFRVISLGGAKVKKSHLMPAFGYTLSEEEIWLLVAFIRYLGNDKSSVTVPDNVQSERPLRPVLTKADMLSFSKWFSENGQAKEQTDSGKTLVMNKKSCLGCHQLNDEGGKIGPSLNRSSSNYKPEWLYAWISNPQNFRPGTRMPNLGLEPKEVRAITSFLVSFQPEEEDEKFATPEDWKQYLSTKGDPKRGENIFYDSEGIANCSKCHLVKGQGGAVGPDLSYVGTSRTREFILESILNPSVVITHGYQTVMILTTNRKFITGIKKNEDESGIDILNKEGKNLHIPRENIKKFKIQKISTMPGNFKDLLEIQDITDVLAYLGSLTLPAITNSEN
jgi:putative heme-binding domain-containing protein